jgi:hypothetical protein
MAWATATCRSSWPGSSSHVAASASNPCVRARARSDPVDYATFSYAPTAAGALAQLAAEVTVWLEGVRALGDEGLDRPCGPAEGPFADAPLAALVLHIHRELIHHLAEVSLLRDLYLHTQDIGSGPTLRRAPSP